MIKAIIGFTLYYSLLLLITLAFITLTEKKETLIETVRVAGIIAIILPFIIIVLYLAFKMIL